MTSMSAHHAYLCELYVYVWARLLVCEKIQVERGNEMVSENFCLLVAYRLKDFLFIMDNNFRIKIGRISDGRNYHVE